jgi:hypothetical protein
MLRTLGCAKTTSMHRDNSWNFDGSATNEAILKPLCQQVEKLLDVPNRRLCRYFGVYEDQYFVRVLGPHYRGFHIAFDREQVRNLPSYLSACFFLPQNEIGKHEPNCPFEELVAFDDLIYLRHSTCHDPTGCVITYAHELQHIVQHGCYPRLLKVNRILRQHRKREIDIPAEVEANIVSKRIAEVVCGVDAVRTFAEAEIGRMEAVGADEKKVRWEFFLNTSSSTVYDVVDETFSLVNMFKARINFEFDVNEPEWWLGSLEQD